MTEFDPTWEGKDEQKWSVPFVQCNGQPGEVVLIKTDWRDWDDGEKISGTWWEVDTPDSLVAYSIEELCAVSRVIGTALYGDPDGLMLAALRSAEQQLSTVKDRGPQRGHRHYRCCFTFDQHRPDCIIGRALAPQEDRP